MHLQKFRHKSKNYANNCKMTKRAHISQFSLEMLQRPCKLLIENEDNQSRHLLEKKLTELNKAFHFWSNNGLEKCFQGTQEMSNFHFFTSLQGLSPQTILQKFLSGNIIEDSWQEGSCSCFQWKQLCLHFSEVNNYMSFLTIPICMRDLESNFIYSLNQIHVPVYVNSHTNAGSSFFDTPLHPLQCFDLFFRDTLLFNIMTAMSSSNQCHIFNSQRIVQVSGLEKRPEMVLDIR